MNKFLGHLKTVLNHKKEVFKNCRKAGIFWQGVFHDLSKFSFVEFTNSVKFYTDGKQSPNNNEKLTKGYSESWLHHKGRNKHHYEYWLEFAPSKENPITAGKMPLKYFKEMFCDRIAATKIYQKENYTNRSPLEYYLSRDEQKLMHEDVSRLLEKCLMLLAIYGEDVAFTYIKSITEKDYKERNF